MCHVVYQVLVQHGNLKQRWSPLFCNFQSGGEDEYYSSLLDIVKERDAVLMKTAED